MSRLGHGEPCSLSRPLQPSPLTSLDSQAAKGMVMSRLWRGWLSRSCVQPPRLPGQISLSFPRRPVAVICTKRRLQIRFAGGAASTLHAMALLQVRQFKALMDLHKGGQNSVIFQTYVWLLT